MSERAPVPEDVWQKFSAENEADIEAERVSIRSEENTGGQKRRQITSEDKARLREATIAASQLPEQPAPKIGTPEANAIFANAIDSGELTYEQYDEMVSKAYHDTPASERNWKRDAGFYQLAEEERQQEVLVEAVRDTRALSETLRVAVRDPEKQRRLRDLLEQIDFELQKESRL